MLAHHVVMQVTSPQANLLLLSLQSNRNLRRRSCVVWSSTWMRDRLLPHELALCIVTSDQKENS
jgi:hypothetical protein